MFTAAIDYFRNPAFAETPPRVIVWEIPKDCRRTDHCFG